jgi:hypothetical protein
VLAEDTRSSEFTEAASHWENLSTVKIGGCEPQVAADMPVARSKQLVQSSQTVGNLMLDLAVHRTGYAHVFHLAQLQGSDLSPVIPLLKMQLPVQGSQARLYMEYRPLAEGPLILAVSQWPFPHEVRAFVWDPRSHQEASITAEEEDMYPFIEHSLWGRLNDMLEQLALFGSLRQMRAGNDGNPDNFRVMPRGREIFPPDPVVRAFQTHVPVLMVDFLESAHSKVPSLSRELLFSGTRYVLSPQVLSDHEMCGKYRQDSTDLLKSVPELQISLWKTTGCQDFTFSINRVGSSQAESVVINVLDKQVARPLGIFGEIQQLGELRLFLMFLDDALPRAVRFVVVEPMSGWSFQLIVLDNSSSSPNMPPILIPSTPRHELLHFFRRRIHTRQNDSPAQPLLALDGPTQQQQARQPRETPGRYQMARKTQLLDDDELVLIALYCEPLEDKGSDGARACFRLTATLSQPVSGRDNQLLVEGFLLDRLLSVCSLPPAAELGSAAALIENEAKCAEVSQLAMEIIQKWVRNHNPLLSSERFTEMLPNLEVELTLQVSQQSSDRGRAAVIGSSTQQAVAPADLPDCRQEKLLGQRLIDSHSPETKLQVEVFDASDSMEALFHIKNLRVQVTRIVTGETAVRDLHEDDLEPWLEVAEATHLLCASREVDLIDAILQHAWLQEEPTGHAASAADHAPASVSLRPLVGRGGDRFPASFVASVEHRSGDAGQQAEGMLRLPAVSEEGAD